MGRVEVRRNQCRKNCRKNWSESVRGLSAGLREQGVRESFRAECEDLRSSSALMVKGQGLAQAGRFLPIATIGSSKHIRFGALLRANQRLALFSFQLDFPVDTVWVLGRWAPAVGRSLSELGFP